MAKYEVIRPWHGVRLGDVVELKKLHPALKANVRPLRGQAAELTPATPGATAGGKPADDGAKLEPATPDAAAPTKAPAKAANK